MVLSIRSIISLLTMYSGGVAPQLPLDSIYGFKTVWPDRMDMVPWKRVYKKPIFDRVIDLATFYTIMMGVEPKELYVGAEEYREIMMLQRTCDVVGYRHSNAMLGKLNGMAVFYEYGAKHHLECK